jgi:2-polyprenyl-3-methyl-5-hydroxy-6-metoxy-1,4-benzoquinol methylase
MSSEDQMQKKDYNYQSAEAPWLDSILWPAISNVLKQRYQGPKRAFEIGSGNGAMAAKLKEQGFEIIGIDPSESGIRQANQAHPDLALHVGSAYDDLASTYGRFPLVYSVEVVEHCYSPHQYARTFFELLEDGGFGVMTTPFHGYWKNLAVALTNKWDSHTQPLEEGGHIKFFSERTLRQLLEDTGFVDIRMDRIGRIRPLAMGMVATFRRPGSS